jgi:hypothetical protein
MSQHTQLPWRVTAPDERRGREIVGADGSTVAKLTALDIVNAELIVAKVNATAEPQAADVGGDAIARSKRILALVDEYVDKQTRDNRTALRGALLDEFQSLLASRPVPQASGQDERAGFEAWYAPMFAGGEVANMPRRSNGEYVSPQAQIAWMAYRAALAAKSEQPQASSALYFLQDERKQPQKQRRLPESTVIEIADRHLRQSNGSYAGRASDVDAFAIELMDKFSEQMLTAGAARQGGDTSENKDLADATLINEGTTPQAGASELSDARLREMWKLAGKQGVAEWVKSESDDTRSDWQWRCFATAIESHLRAAGTDAKDAQRYRFMCANGHKPVPDDLAALMNDAPMPKADIDAAIDAALASQGTGQGEQG